MIIAAAGIGEQRIRADVSVVPSDGVLLFYATVASAAMVQVAVRIIPEDAINDVRGASPVSANTQTVVGYSQVSKCGRGTIEEDGSPIGTVAAGDYKITQDTIRTFGIIKRKRVSTVGSYHGCIVRALESDCLVS